MRYEYFEPRTVEEATEILRCGGDQYKVLAGGTDLINQLRRRAASYKGLVNIKRLPGIGTLCVDPGKGLRIGAATLMRDLEISPAVAEKFPSLVDCLRVIGSIQLRNIATVGGNLCNASPAADTAPPLIVLGATAAFVNGGPDIKTVPVEKFFAGPGRSVLGLDGLLLWVDVPEPQGMTGQSFERLTPRGALDIAIVSAASRVTLEPRTGRIVDAVIALGAVAPTAVRTPRAEHILRGEEPTPKLLSQAGETAMKECDPIDDIRGTSTYRHAMVRVLVQRSLRRSLERASQRAGISWPA